MSLRRNIGEPARSAYLSTPLRLWHERKAIRHVRQTLCPVTAARDATSRPIRYQLRAASGQLLSGVQ